MKEEHLEKIGFGGSCHWCTEAIFQSLKGVTQVAQGWIAGEDSEQVFSEAVIVTFDPEIIALETLIAVHLHTHSCTGEHSMRSKYRSAIYIFPDSQSNAAKQALNALRADFDKPVITEIVPFGEFRENIAQYLDYYYNNPEKPFCETYISPKLRYLMRHFGDVVGTGKTEHLQANFQ